MNRRLAGQAVVLLLTVAAGTAGADERAPLYLCGLSSADDVRAAAALDRILATAQPLSGDRETCEGPPKVPRAIVVERGPGQVALLLEGPAMALERVVPWLSESSASLVELERQGRLASFAILLEALLAEYRLTAAALAVPPPVAPALGPAGPGTKPTPEVGRGAKGPKARAPTRPEPAPRAGSRSTPEPASPPVQEPEPVLSSSPGNESEPASPPHQEPEPEPMPATGPAAVESSARLPLEGSGEVAEPSRTESLAPSPVPELLVGIRIRQPGLVHAEYGAALRIGSIFVATRVQPGANWTVEERPLSVFALGLEAGWLPSLWAGNDGRVRGRVAVVGERLALRQLDLPGKVEHQALDAGLAVGLEFDRRLLGGVWASVGLDGIWMPTAGDLVIEDEWRPARAYVRVPFNGVGARATLSVHWQR